MMALKKMLIATGTTANTSSSDVKKTYRVGTSKCCGM
jgi:hypothetical protein